MISVYLLLWKGNDEGKSEKNIFQTPYLNKCIGKVFKTFDL
jgi:hypothetical protein